METKDLSNKLAACRRSGHSRIMAMKRCAMGLPPSCHSAGQLHLQQWGHTSNSELPKSVIVLHSIYLAEWAGTLDHDEEDDNPALQQTHSQTSLYRPHVVYTVWQLQHIVAGQPHAIYNQRQGRASKSILLCRLILSSNRLKYLLEVFFGWRFESDISGVKGEAGQICTCVY